MIKAITMDMDGTLLNSNDEIMPKTKQALIALEKQGVRLVLSSGRSYRRLMKYAKELEMDRYGGYLVEVNGIALYDVKQDQRKRLASFSLQECKDLFAYFKDKEMEVIGNMDDGLFCYMTEEIYEYKKHYRKEHKIAKDFPWTAGAFSVLSDMREGYPHQRYIKDESEINVIFNKICVTHFDPSRVAAVMEQAKRDFKDSYWLGLTTKRWLEIMPKGITKAGGLSAFCEASGITFDEILAFGDGENDIAMLDACGKAIAMENALDSVKEHADFVTATNNDEGIAKGIAYFREEFICD